ncbi:histone family protein DNA-binding protein [Candidatus Symbiothrix dinenymphae]|nr:histone family protein DNA-binding protein [Candidatus Symbiothrix dinenymphae]
MNNAELTNALASKSSLPKTEVTQRVDDMINILKAELLEHNIIALGNLGTLEVVQRNSRVYVHPTSGKEMQTPPKYVVKFKTSNKLKDRLKEQTHE